MKDRCTYTKLTNICYRKKTIAGNDLLRGKCHVNLSYLQWKKAHLHTYIIYKSKWKSPLHTLMLSTRKGKTHCRSKRMCIKTPNLQKKQFSIANQSKESTRYLYLKVSLLWFKDFCNIPNNSNHEFIIKSSENEGPVIGCYKSPYFSTRESNKHVTKKYVSLRSKEDMKKLHNDKINLSKASTHCCKFNH